MKFRISLSISLLMLSVLSIVPAQGAGTSLTTPPQNIESFKSKIVESLVGISCNNESSIGFSAKWNVSDSDKNSGTNSHIFTTGQSLFKCGRYGASVPFEYKGKSYSGKIWNSGGTLPDFGAFSSSVIIPDLPLWGSDAPVERSWVAVVRFAPGFGFIWSESKVRAYNPETLIFAIDPLTPSIDRNALVFNNRGHFIGVLSKQTVKQVEGLVTAHGAPLQCPLNKNQTSPSVTSCKDGDYAQSIWKKTSNTPISETCVSGSSGGGFTEKFSLDEQCTPSATWKFTFCDASHPKLDLQVKKNGTWKSLKTFKGVLDETCTDAGSRAFYLESTSKVASRIKLYGNSKFQASYINLNIAVK